MAKLNLKNPIIFFDLETTGTNSAADRIVEISYLRISPNGEEMSRTMRINPEMPIPAAATAIHHITDEDVASCPTFRQVAVQIAKDFEGCDIAGYNSNNFDVPMLVEELMRAGADFNFTNKKLIDVQVIFHKMEQRTLSAAYKFYCGGSLNDAHSAEADTRATYEVLKSQLDRYPELPNDIEALSKFTTYNRNVDFAGRIVYNENNVEVFNFGKYKGVPVSEVFAKDLGYYGWIMNGDFPQYTKKVFSEIRLRNAKIKN